MLNRAGHFPITLYIKEESKPSLRDLCESFYGVNGGI